MLKDKIAKIKEQAKIIEDIEVLEKQLQTTFKIGYMIRENPKGFPGVPFDIEKSFESTKEITMSDILNYITWLEGRMLLTSDHKEERCLRETLKETLVDLSLELIRRKLSQLDI